MPDSNSTNDGARTFSVVMTEGELDKFLERIDKWNLHVRNMIHDLCEKARLEIKSGERDADDAFENLRNQVKYQYGHNRDILQSQVSLVMHGGAVKPFTNGVAENGSNEAGG